MTEKHKQMIDELYNNSSEETKRLYDKKSGIYAIFCDENLVYIGKSTNLLNRWIAHKCHVYCEESKEYNRPMYKELRRAINQGHKVSISLVEYCTPEELESEERKYIAEFLPPLNTMIPIAGGGQTKKAIALIC